jgi:hypothetical protein
LPVGCTQFAPVGHTETEDVHVLARPGSDSFGEEADADAHELTALTLGRLLGSQLVVAGHVECELQRARVVARVVLPTGRRGVRELFRP